MKKTISILFFAFTLSTFGQYKDGKELLKAMHKKFAGKYCKTIEFDQKTTKYDSIGAVKDTSFWYEWISYPDKFRIDYGKKYGANSSVFRNDSAFIFKDNKMVKSRIDENDLLLLLGGMYYRTIEDVFVRMERQGYDLSKVGEIERNGKQYYFLNSKDEKNKRQLLVDKKTLRVEMIKSSFGTNAWYEIRFEEFKKTCEGFNETRVTIYKNDKLEQRETYLNLKTGMAIPDSLFRKK